MLPHLGRDESLAALAAFGIFNDPAALELYGIIWNIYMEYIWNIYGIYMEYIWKYAQKSFKPSFANHLSIHE